MILTEGIKSWLSYKATTSSHGFRTNFLPRFEGEERNTIFVMGRPAVLESLKGGQKEEFSVDIGTGMLTKSFSKTNINGNILVLTNQVPLTITSTKEITVGKLTEK